MSRSIAFVASLLCLCLCLIGTFCPAQDKAKNTLGKVSPGDFNLPSSSIIDSSTSAVVLSDIGELSYVGNRNGWFSYVYKRQTRIKVLNKQAFDLAKVEVYLRGREGHPDKISKVEGVTYNNENGQVIETKLEDKDVFVKRVDKYSLQAAFSMPGVKEGSIIQYTYTITSEAGDYPPAWEFQWEDYPCLNSEYHVTIPQAMFFVLIRQGVHSYAVDKGSTGHASYRVAEKNDNALVPDDNILTVTANTTKHDWVMKNIPAFGEEPYITTAGNYIDKISFQLSGTNNGEETTRHTDTWAKATEELLADQQFDGAVGQDDNRLDDLAGKIPTEGMDETAKARAIYYYISRHFTCTDHNYPYVVTSLPDVIKTNNGTVGDINLLLLDILRRKGLHADPVMLSTRENGFTMISYPVIKKFNYVIVRLKLNNGIYYLDAAHPQLGFGKLATNCYNGHARIISKTDSGSVYLEADSLHENRVTMVLLTGTDKGLEGSWQSTLGPQQSYELRRDVGRQGQSQYFKDLQTRYGDDLQISDGGIDSLNRPEDPAKVHFDFLFKQQQLGASVIYLNPILADGLQENPFQAAERKYPVEMYYAIDHLYIFSMALPDGYAVDELPKSAKVAFNGNQGYFEYLIVQQDGRVELRCRVRLNKAWFAPEDYSALRDFFAFIVKKENEQIVLKKK